ncbi:hypothetical protein TH25_16030 [Thalassospira profundimaris]|uniref:Uncharacterized protein n=1 Tax=Thalassospira profundimaris TaxID=502049 RepID=A0A367X013_9PROT|nr:hypothetical protein [Thalassospira profundimaris]RCK47026.1 hypothetical protein TH25_16030 [Thalassospira profundimaris]
MFGAGKFIMAVLAVTCLFYRPMDAHARNGLTFKGFEANLFDVLSGVATYCQHNPGRMAFAASGADYGDVLFRKACGAGVSHAKLPFGDWNIFYSEAEHPDGYRSIFAVIRQFIFGGREYLLVIGDEMFVRFPGQEKQEITRRPAALLNVREDRPGRWVEVIDYVASSGAGWNVRTGSLSDFSAAQQRADDNVHAIWQRIVAADFGRLVRNMKDMRWPD